MDVERFTGIHCRLKPKFSNKSYYNWLMNGIKLKPTLSTMISNGHVSFCQSAPCCGVIVVQAASGAPEGLASADNKQHPITRRTKPPTNENGKWIFILFIFFCVVWFVSTTSVQLAMQTNTNIRQTRVITDTGSNLLFSHNLNRKRITNHFIYLKRKMFYWQRFAQGFAVYW